MEKKSRDHGSDYVSSLLFRSLSLSLSLTRSVRSTPRASLGPSFSFLRGDRYPRLYYKYTCNCSEGARPLLSRRRTKHTSTVLTCARCLPTAQPYTARIRCTVTCIVYGRYHICLRTDPVPPPQPSSYLSSSFVLPRLALSLSLSLSLLPRCVISVSFLSPQLRGIKYNKDIQWELIGYLRICHPLWAALLLRSHDGARSFVSSPLLSSHPSRFSLVHRARLLPLSLSVSPRTRSSYFTFFAGRTAGSNGDIPRRNNIEARF